MKNLIRRLSRVADSAQYNLLRPDSNCRSESLLRSLVVRRTKKPTSSVPKGHVQVYVGDEKERFAVGRELLNHPVFIGLLNRSAEKYGYEQAARSATNPLSRHGLRTYHGVASSWNSGVQ